MYNIIGDIMSVIEDKLMSLSKSRFRSSFHLRKYMINYIKEKGMAKIEEDAYYFIKNRISDTSKFIDGKQTPMKGHPVFIAEHATATCCRGCLKKWYGIEKDRPLTEHEIAFCVALIIGWINKEMESVNN